MNQQELAASLCKAVATQFNIVSKAFQKDPGETTTLAASVALVGLSATAMYITKASPEKAPTQDDLQFTCLFVANSCHYNNEGTAMVEFAIPNVIKTLEQFKELMGRDFNNLNSTLMDVVTAERNKADDAFQGDLTKFKPL
jgi:hypothetical protein